MTDQQHPIIPPPELVERLRSEAPHGIRDAGATRERHLAIAAYRAGADAELGAILKIPEEPSFSEEDTYFDGLTVAAIRAIRRPKPPSLAEEALDALEKVDEYAVTNVSQLAIHGDLVAGVGAIRAALKRLQELEQDNG